MPEKQIFGDMLFSLRESKQMSQEALGDLIGVSRSAVNGYEKGKSFPVPDKLVKLARHFGVTVDYLLTGESANSAAPQNSSSYKQPENQLHVVREEKPAPYSKATDGLRILTVQVGADNEENIEFVGTKAAAGYGAGGFLEKEFIGNLPHFRLPDAAYRNGSFRCFQVSGESMQSTLYNGDWVICRYIERWDRDIRDNRVYVVVTEDGIRVKRLLNRLTERGNLALQSDNMAFPVDFVDGGEVREVWEAVGRLSRQFVNPRFDIATELARHNAEIAELFVMVRGLKGSGEE